MNWASAAKRAVSSMRSITTPCCLAAATLTASGKPRASRTPAMRTMSSGSSRVRNGNVRPLRGGRDEAVADPAHGLDQGGQPQLGAQGGDVHLQGSARALPARTPHLADDLFTAEHHAGPLGEQREEV